MKRIGHLFDQVCAFPNLLRAAHKAQVGKRYRPNVLVFNLRLEDNLHALRRELLDGSYRPGAHRHFQVHELKTRWISVAPYRDRVVHHALCNVIEPVIDRRLIYDCWANRTGKGSHRAVLRYQLFAGRLRCQERRQSLAAWRGHVGLAGSFRALGDFGLRRRARLGASPKRG